MAEPLRHDITGCHECNAEAHADARAEQQAEQQAKQRYPVGLLVAVGFAILAVIAAHTGLMKLLSHLF
ncbi:hypothetical protein ACIQU6_41020 [Streptomyces sp. NPDC090442]|uniref:hypothetical protein n=1 Tax=Streptomyces sp. NPDC090442 TaxID=3365962 RepID=UPI0038131002